MKSRVIGIGLLAHSGKDTAFKILSFYIKAKQFAFAESIKEACRPLCLSMFGIDSFTNDSREKSIIRPIILAVGCAGRAVNKRLWIDKIKPQIEETLEKTNNFVIVTDVRYTDKGSELDFIQKELKGIVVNIDRILPDGSKLPPNNPEEEEHYPKFKKRADVNITARTIDELRCEIIDKLLTKL